MAKNPTIRVEPGTLQVSLQLGAELQRAEPEDRLRVLANLARRVKEEYRAAFEELFPGNSATNTTFRKKSRMIFSQAISGARVMGCMPLADGGLALQTDSGTVFVLRPGNGAGIGVGRAGSLEDAVLQAACTSTLPSEAPPAKGAFKLEEALATEARRVERELPRPEEL